MSKQKYRGGSEMHYSAGRVKQEYGATGILYDPGSVYEGLSKIKDKRKARGKLYRLEMILMIILLAKLSGEDKPTGIAEWGKHHGEELVKLMQLHKPQMPSVNTYRGILAEVACQEEVERMVGKYNQGGEYVFPVKENQVSLYKNIQQLFAPEYPKAGFGKIETDFQTVEKVNKGHGRLEKRTLTTSEMLNSYSTWPGLAQVYRLERQFQWWRNGRCYRTSCEVEFGITSLSRAKITPECLLGFRRNHWGIETGLHYRRDVTFKEDATRMTIGNTGKIMASLNNLVIALIHQANFNNAAQARRWFAAHLAQAFALLSTPFS